MSGACQLSQEAFISHLASYDVLQAGMVTIGATLVVPLPWRPPSDAAAVAPPPGCDSCSSSSLMWQRQGVHGDCDFCVLRCVLGLGSICVSRGGSPVGVHLGALWEVLGAPAWAEQQWRPTTMEIPHRRPTPPVVA
jgi:hypothetical protein